MSELKNPQSSETVYGIIFNLIHADVQEPTRLGPNSWLLHCHTVTPDDELPWQFQTGVEVVIPEHHEGIVTPYYDPMFRMIPFVAMANIKPGSMCGISMFYAPVVDPRHDDVDMPGPGFVVCKLEVRKVATIDVIHVTRKESQASNYNIIRKSLGDLNQNSN
jgi:hypothetical protein